MNVDDVNEICDRFASFGLMYCKKRDLKDNGENVYDQTPFGKWVGDKDLIGLVSSDDFTLEDAKQLKMLFEKDQTK